MCYLRDPKKAVGHNPERKKMDNNINNLLWVTVMFAI